MDTSKKRHFVFTDLFATMDRSCAHPRHDKETLKQACSDRNYGRLLHECKAMPKSKEISIGMLTNDVQQMPLPCIQQKWSSCREYEPQAETSVIKFPLRDCANRSVIRMAENGVTLVPKTPPKSSKAPVEPLTPTSNLKLLTDLASRENVPHQEEFENEFQDEDYENTVISADVLKYTSRKDKSLGLLTTKFLSQYPEYPSAEFITEISLDKASKNLNVGRRRIYDVVNVLEAVQIVKKCAKNVYAWLGKTNLKLTMARFKKLACQEKLGDQIVSLKSLSSRDQLNGMLIDCSNSNSASSSRQLESDTPLPSEIPTLEVVKSLLHNPFIRKEKSLGMMSQTFMMLLLVSKPQVLSLDLAARFLIGESGSDDKNSTVYKTKMRRLYSITHVLTSLALIEKVDCMEMRGGRKPAYRYSGPNFDDISSTDLKDFESALMSLQSSPMLLNKKPVTEDESTCLSSNRVKLPRTRSESVILNKRPKWDGKSLLRRPSLQDVCEVAEKERRRLLFPFMQRALNTIKEPEKIAASKQICLSSTKPVSKTKTSTAILLTSDGTPLRVISILSSPDGSSMLRLVPSTVTDESITQVKPEGLEVPVVQLPLVLQIKSELHS